MIRSSEGSRFLDERLRDLRRRRKWREDRLRQLLKWTEMMKGPKATRRAIRSAKIRGTYD